MRNKIIALMSTLAGLLAVLSLTIFTMAPAPAAPVQVKKAWLTDVTHAKDDSGYVADIHVVCTNGNHRYLGPGDSTVFSSSTACSGGGVQRIVVGWDQTVYCKNYLPPYQNIYYYTYEYNEVPSYASLKCYMQRPL